MYYPTKEEFVRRSKHGNLIPVYREILADMETPVSAYRLSLIHISEPTSGLQTTFIRCFR